MALGGCDRNLLYGEPSACKQIDVPPLEESALPGDGVSSTTVDVAVCNCTGAAVCDDADLLTGVTLSLSLSQPFLGDDDGQLDLNQLYLYDGRGTVG